MEEIIREKNPSAQRRAIRQIRTLGPAAKSAAPTLLKAVDENEGDVRWLAAVTLVYADPPQRLKALPALLEEIKKESSLWSSDTAEALAEFGPAAKEAVPALQAALASKRHFPYHQAKIIKGLTRIDRGQIPLCRPAIEELLKCRQAGVVYKLDALMLLPEWGTDAKPLAPELRELATKEGINANVEIAAAVSLVLAGGDEDGTGLKIIRKAINTPENGQKREHLLHIADQLGPLTKPLASELRPLSTDAKLGEYAKVVLAKIDPKID